MVGYPKGQKTVAKIDNRFSKPGLPATSAIMLKADKLRFHARENIKIVTKGLNENINSQGNSIATEDVGIHLVCNNGYDVQKPSKELLQHPMVLGSNLEAAFEGILEMFEETLRIIDNVVTTQQKFNAVLANHFHLSGTGPTIFDFFSAWKGISTTLEHLITGTQQCYFEQMNLASFQSKFLTYGQEQYICSKYNTVN